MNDNERSWQTWSPRTPAHDPKGSTSDVAPPPTLTVPRVADFDVSGSGENDAWSAAEWTVTQRTGPGASIYTTLFKSVYSPTGLYLLVDCQDGVLTATKTRDMDEIWKEDVLEIFLWPDERQPLYFQYDVSPLGVELPLLIPNNTLPMGWAPWRYGGERRVVAKTAAHGGPRASMARVVRWTAEIKIPFVLLVGLIKSPPEPGTRWRANVYRTDYDVLPASHWAWSVRAGTDTHAIQDYGTFVFG
jgi:Carbohydrate family 9 binding domain-like